MPRANYPATVAEILNPNRKYKPAVLRALRAFRRSRPWRGTDSERIEKIGSLNSALAAAYGIDPPRLFIRLTAAAASGGNGFYSPGQRTIGLVGTLSVVTYLHEFAHAVFGSCERQACGWSVNLFARIFPRSFARCRRVGHMLVRRRP